MQRDATEPVELRLLDQQLKKLEEVRGLSSNSPRFIAWRDTTATVLQRLLDSDSPHLKTFSELKFRSQIVARRLPFRHRGPIPRSTESPKDKARFENDCGTAAECIMAVIEQVRLLGQSWPSPQSAQVHRKPENGHKVEQYFYGPANVQQAISSDGIQNFANQNVWQESLEETVSVLRESGDLRKRDLDQALAAKVAAAIELRKPEQVRNWRLIFDSAKTLLDVAKLATDVASKLGPSLPHLTSLAKHCASFF